MCRWATYSGSPIYLEEIVLKPAHSLIDQSLNASKGATTVNGDGFGLAWYGERKEPGFYRDILPAWSDGNLKSLVQQVRSSMFLAHVRASTGTETSRTNCHPFVFGNWSFMHNGQIGRYGVVRRALDTMLPDALYNTRNDTTDSEAMFLPAIEKGLDADPVAAIASMLGAVRNLCIESLIEPDIRFTAVLSDGSRVIAVRHATDGSPPTLYYRRSYENQGWIVASEPTDVGEPGWIAVPANSVVEIVNDALTVSSFAVN